MPEVDGTYIATLTVAGGGVGTAATVLVVDPTGATPSITPSGGPTAWEAIIPVATAGWWLARWTVTGPGVGVKSKRFYVTPTPTSWGVWPPCLADMKLDMGSADDQDDSQDAGLSVVLDAAIAKVIELKGDVFDLDEDPTGESGESGAPDRNAPDAALILGTLRLAIRWLQRRRTPDMSMAQAAGELGRSVVPGFDPDIDRLLRLGRFRPPAEMFA